jgi:transposase-like protein
MPCKFCGKIQVQKHGYTLKGQQRYRCVDCKRTFITCLGRCTLLDIDYDYIQQLHVAGVSIRKISQALGKTSAFPIWKALKKEEKRLRLLRPPSSVRLSA